MKKQFDFIGKRVILFAIAGAFILCGVVSVFLRGFNVGQDFTGGTKMTFTLRSTEGENEVVSINGDVKKEVKGIVEGLGVSGVEVTDGEKGEVIVNTNFIDGEKQLEVKKAIAEKYMVKDEEYSYESISGNVSRDLRDKAIIGSAIAVLLILVYISFRFDWRSGIAAILCLVHDMLIMLFAYSLFAIPMDSNMIAAILTIFGYSINATIIVFDRVRENNRMNPKNTFAENVNIAVNKTFTRSLNTTLTTLFTIGMIYILGPASIKDFALPIIVGVLAGLYSSVCLSSNFWVMLKGKKAFSKED